MTSAKIRTSRIGLNRAPFFACHSLWSRHGKSFANAPREIRVAVSGLRLFRDIAAPFKLRERQAGVDHATLVAELIEIAIGEKFPVQGPRHADFLGVVTDRRGAVMGERVVPTRRCRQTIDLAQISEQHRARLLRRMSQPLEKDLLAPMFCP